MQQHSTVLKREAVEGLQLRPDATVIDATFGSGGHSTHILEILDARGMLVALDADQDAITHGKDAVANARATVELVHANFREIARVANEYSLQSVDAVLADLGWRIEQFTGNGKGFSFQIDEPLLMTYGDPESYLFTARDIVNEWEEEHLADIIKGYGEERFTRRIVRAIIEARSVKPIETSVELAEIITHAVPARYQHGRIHPATRTFQALRIAVNDELGALSALISDAFELLAPGGRLAIISFHSIEDRVVKRAFRAYVHDQRGFLPNKKPIVPTDEEVDANPRARSAKLRVIEKT